MPWRRTSLYDNVVFDCRSMLSRLAAWELRHVYREQNQATDAMAREGIKHGQLGNVKVSVVPRNKLYLTFPIRAGMWPSNICLLLTVLRGVKDQCPTGYEPGKPLSLLFA